MNFLEILRLAFSSLRANKLRSSLTVLGMTIGIFSIITVMTVMTAARATLESSLSRLGTNSFQIEKFPGINFSDPRQRYGNRPDITLTVAERFKEMMGDSAKVSLQIRRGGLIAHYLDRTTSPNTRLTGTDENFQSAANYEIATGRNLSPEDVILGRSVCVIGDEIAAKLFPDETAIGKLIRVGGQTYTVIGQFAAKGSSFGESQDNFIAIPITRWLAVLGRSWRSININVQASSREEFEAVQDKAIGAMRLARGLDPEDENNFETFTNDSLIETFNTIMTIVAAGAFAISTISLLAAGVGVMNIMLVSVTERTKEIGIRKSIGARKKSILQQFLTEAVVLSLAGGVIGVAVGCAGGAGLAMAMNMAFAFPWVSASAGLAVCGGIGVVFGLYPAWKAASLDPIEALRHE